MFQTSGENDGRLAVLEKVSQICFDHLHSEGTCIEGKNSYFQYLLTVAFRRKDLSFHSHPEEDLAFGRHPNFPNRVV